MTASLPTFTFEDCGVTVSRLALGGFHQLEITSEVVAEVIETFLSEGGTYIESARGYGAGASEMKIGRALSGRRDRVTLASKTGAATADEAFKDLETSLELLGTDHIAFYFLHGVMPDKLERITRDDGAAAGLRRARDEGLISGIGLSSHSPEVYLEAMERIDLSLILVWFNYLDNLNFPVIPDRVVPEARRRGVAVTAMKPLADGLLHASVDRAIPYCLGAGADVAVCGMNSPEQVHTAAAAVRLGPADADRRAETLAEAPELGAYVCRRCGGCPPELMDTFRMEGEHDRQMVDGYPHGPADNALRKVLSGWFAHQDLAREQFGRCGYDVAALLAAAEQVTCPYHVDVVRKTRLATAKLTGRSIATI